MKERVKAFAPATVANVGCAFDILGFALSAPGDIIEAALRNEKGAVMASISGDGGRLPVDAKKNTASVAAEAYLRHIGAERGVSLTLEKNMPLGSGMGSSAASAAAAVFAVNVLFGSPLTPQQLVPFAMEGERAACGSTHADNVAPSLMGGFVLIRSYSPLDLIQVPAPAELYCTVCHPEIEVRTVDARRVLKEHVPLASAVAQWGNIAGLISGLWSADYSLIGRSLVDVIIEPVRSLLIPRFSEVRHAALANGALGCGISGSGPSLFALSRSEAAAQKIGTAMQKAFNEGGIAGSYHAGRVDSRGARLIDE